MPMRLSAVVGAIVVVMLTLAPVKVNLAPLTSLALGAVKGIAGSSP
jgi:hypothetical protein